MGMVIVMRMLMVRWKIVLIYGNRLVNCVSVS